MLAVLVALWENIDLIIKIRSDFLQLKNGLVRQNLRDNQYENNIMKVGEGQNSQLSGEVHTPVGPQTFMGLVGHCNHPGRRELP